MPTGYRHLILPAAIALLGSNAVCGDAASGGLRYSFEPRLFSSTFTTNEAEDLSEARLSSGLELAVENPLLAISLDYQVESLLKEAGELDNGDFSQQVGASMRSSLLNELFGIDAALKANSSVSAGGDAWHYRVSPGFSKSIDRLADVSVEYRYELDKAHPQAIEVEKTGYAMGLEGSLQDGRLTWQGEYSASDTYQGQLAQTQSLELLKFQSRYQVVSDLQLELSSAIKDETLIEGGSAGAVTTERRYGAGVVWSPSRHYSLALKLNKLDEERSHNENVFGSGSVSWFPQPHMEFSLSYGDQLVDGARGLMFNTRFDLGDS